MWGFFLWLDEEEDKEVFLQIREEDEQESNGKKVINAHGEEGHKIDAEKLIIFVKVC